MNAIQKILKKKKSRGEKQPVCFLLNIESKLRNRMECSAFVVFVKTEKGKTKKEDRKLIVDGWKKKKKLTHEKKLQKGWERRNTRLARCVSERLLQTRFE